MEAIDAYYQPGVIDCFTVVTDKVDPLTGYRTMIALGNDPNVFSQFTEGQYTPDGDNSHLGAQVCLMGKHLVEHVLGRLTEGA